MLPSEEDLVQRAICGDEPALGELLHHYQSEVRSSICVSKRWQSVLDARDVMQEAFVDACQGIGGFEPRGPGSFVAWLRKLARNKLLGAQEMLETHKRGGGWGKINPNGAGSGMNSEDGLLDHLMVTSGTPSRAASRRELRALLRRAVGKLPAKDGCLHRRVVEMYDLGGLSVEAVAKAVGKSIGAVFMIRQRAHRRLAELLGRSSLFFSRI